MSSDPNYPSTCSCNTCDNVATVFLEIVYQPTTGFYCENCASDLRLHRIAVEVIPDDYYRETREDK